MGFEMRQMHLRILAVTITTTLLLVPAYSQQSHWASADDKTAKYIIEMERKWAEGECVDNGVIAGLLADDFQGTSTTGALFTKADALKDEKGPHFAHDCELGEVRVRFFGDSLSVVYGGEHYVGKDKSAPNVKVCQVWTDTWLKRGGSWQIIASQDNRAQCK
jgi:Domain of unknown function (DUF4440)